MYHLERWTKVIYLNIETLSEPLFSFLATIAVHPDRMNENDAMK